jgi:hypothetical protein
MSEENKSFLRMLGISATLALAYMPFTALFNL